MHFCTILWLSYLLQMRTTKSSLYSWGLKLRTGKHQHRGWLGRGFMIINWHVWAVTKRVTVSWGENGVRNRSVWGSLNWDIGIWMRREVLRWWDPARIAQICCTICSAPFSPASPLGAVLVPLWPLQPCKAHVVFSGHWGKNTKIEALVLVALHLD